MLPAGQLAVRIQSLIEKCGESSAVHSAGEPLIVREVPQLPVDQFEVAMEIEPKCCIKVHPEQAGDSG